MSKGQLPDFLSNLMSGLPANKDDDDSEPAEDQTSDAQVKVISSGEVKNQQDIVYYMLGEAIVPGPRVSPNYIESLPVGTYAVAVDMKIGPHLVKAEDLDPPPQVFGSINRMADRIVSTFGARDSTTGVLLAGEKGSGKSLLTKIVSSRLRHAGISTIIVTEPFHGGAFNRFIQNINAPALVIFDEFEKVYNEDKQQHLLTLMDGMFPTKKLFMLTCNDKWRVDKNMRNRPGRLFYNIEFRGMTEEDIIEYCTQKLQNKEHLDSVIKFATSFYTFNFDMLKALVEEMNRYNEPAAEAFKLLNVKPESGSHRTQYRVSVTNAAGKVISQRGASWSGDPFKEADPDDIDNDYVSLSTYDPEAIDADTGKKNPHGNAAFTRAMLVFDKCVKGKIVCFDPDTKLTLTMTPVREREPTYTHLF